MRDLFETSKIVPLYVFIDIYSIIRNQQKVNKYEVRNKIFYFTFLFCSLKSLSEGTEIEN